MSLTCVQCPAGWQIYYNHCYYVGTTAMTWDNALAECQKYGATLMVVRNQQEYNLLYNYYLQYANGGWLWVSSLK